MLLTVKQAAAELNVCVPTVRKLIERGQLPAVNISKANALRTTYRVDPTALRTFNNLEQAHESKPN